VLRPEPPLSDIIGRYKTLLKLADALGDINPDELTPRAALDALYALKRLTQAKAIGKP